LSTLHHSIEIKLNKLKHKKGVYGKTWDKVKKTVLNWHSKANLKALVVFFNTRDFLQLQPLLCRAEAGVLLGLSYNMKRTIYMSLMEAKKCIYIKGHGLTQNSRLDTQVWIIFGANANGL
jgi:hypothetical protein